MLLLKQYCSVSNMITLQPYWSFMSVTKTIIHYHHCALSSLPSKRLVASTTRLKSTQSASTLCVSSFSKKASSDCYPLFGASRKFHLNHSRNSSHSMNIKHVRLANLPEGPITPGIRIRDEYSTQRGVDLEPVTSHCEATDLVSPFFHRKWCLLASRALKHFDRSNATNQSTTATKMTTSNPVDYFSWEKISPLPDPKHGCPISRSSHGLSVIKNINNESSSGLTLRVIVCGGENIARTPIEASNAYWSANLNTEGTWQWQLITATGPPPDRIAHAQAVKDGCIYVFGGRGGISMEEKAMNDLWKLDCSKEVGKETWSQVEIKGGTSPPEARSFHRMICLGNSLYVFGGCIASGGRAKDLYRFDLDTHTWHDLGASPLLRGRGGPNLLPLSGGKKIGVIAGFAGEETADGHIFNVETGQWDEKLLEEELEGMRPRSVCVSGSFPALGYSIIFGGEVDPSDCGHEGAGSFENDILMLEESTGKFIKSFVNDTQSDGSNGNAIGSSTSWPQVRGWSDSASVDADETNSCGKLYVFGGLAGDDTNPERLDDFWALSLQKMENR